VRGPHEGESTDAGHRGGAVRSREEGSVMELDRRDCVVQLYRGVNQKMGGAAWIKQSHFVFPSGRLWEAYKRVKANQGAAE